ncbi:MAG: hypothetical protein Harvfovirus2_57 [Harvfovirus sp.]|uniref:Uncharacterized protein n=1 Tax=Harvfovirus sp. TaxID=2487768 RepID=A0A3G5A024_9VIRU|nr:MAG: hypothetical protein Harvfovirus2_57 [Harvfovirus sp.]
MCFRTRGLGVTYLVIGIFIVAVGGIFFVPRVAHELLPIDSEMRVGFIGSEIVGTFNFSQGLLSLVYAGVSPMPCNMIENTLSIMELGYYEGLCYTSCPGPRVGNHYQWCLTHNGTWSNVSSYVISIGVSHNSKFILLEQPTICSAILSQVNTTCLKSHEFKSKNVYCQDSCSYEKYSNKIIVTVIGMILYFATAVIFFYAGIQLIIIDARYKL